MNPNLKFNTSVFTMSELNLAYEKTNEVFLVQRFQAPTAKNPTYVLNRWKSENKKILPIGVRDHFSITIWRLFHLSCKSSKVGRVPPFFNINLLWRKVLQMSIPTTYSYSRILMATIHHPWSKVYHKFSLRFAQRFKLHLNNLISISLWNCLVTLN